MKKLISAAILLAVALPGQSAYVVRIKDLQYSPTPPNPIKVAGRVMSASPLKLNDGTGEITVAGIAAAPSDFLVVTGDWDGSILTLSGAVEQAIPPAPCEMVYIPAGSFLMGNSGIDDDATYGECDEHPQHSVYLSGYWVGKYEVTRGEYRRFIEADGYTNPAWWSSAGWSWRLFATSSFPTVAPPSTQPSYWAPTQTWGGLTFSQTDSHPVVGLSYYEAEAYCNWAGGHLPTEAQWEKAARWDGTPRVYPWGNAWDPENCNNYNDHSPEGGGYRQHQTSPVGSYPAGASPYGLQDMAGNVWEWCKDWYKSYPGSSSPFDYAVSYRVLRGGGWSLSHADNTRCASRGSSGPADIWYSVGFRLSR